jgi:hypothetical protein
MALIVTLLKSKKKIVISKSGELGVFCTTNFMLRSRCGLLFIVSQSLVSAAVLHLGHERRQASKERKQWTHVLHFEVQHVPLDVPPQTHVSRSRAVRVVGERF